MGIFRETDERLSFLRELLSCCHNLYSWTYDSTLDLVYTNCPDDLIFNLIFVAQGNSLPLFPAPKDAHPVIASNQLGLMWVADFEYHPDGSLRYIHVLGPAFYDDIFLQTLNTALDNMELNQALKHRFSEVLQNLPLIPTIRFIQYGQMLHFTLTGQKIATSDFEQMKTTDVLTASTPPKQPDHELHHGTWMAEQAMMKLVEEGNLNYRKARDQLSAMGPMGKFSTGDPIRQVKNQIIVLTTLCTRAAIRGGLSPDTAYTLSDRYIQDAESCETVAALAEVGRAMEQDFVLRVHQIRQRSEISAQILQCCDYIQLHINEKITVTQLAQLVGYTENYLVKKFHQETGNTISSYIAKEKMEHAKLLLRDTSLSVQDISEQLGYATQSHFGAKFRTYTGMSPSQWRDHKI